MAEVGRFDAKLKLDLTSCDSIPPFGDAVEIPGLCGASLFRLVCLGGTAAIAAKPAEGEKPAVAAVPAVAKTSACVELTNGKSSPKLLILRPLQLFTEFKDPAPAGSPPNPQPGWEDIDKSGATRDQLKCCDKGNLTCKVGGHNVKFGRPLFLMDGLVELLLGANQEAIAEFDFTTFEFQVGPADKLLTKIASKVSVAVIAAYASQECPKEQECGKESVVKGPQAKTQQQDE